MSSNATSAEYEGAYGETKAFVWMALVLMAVMTILCMVQARKRSLQKQRVPVETPGEAKGDYESVQQVEGAARRRLVKYAVWISRISILTTGIAGIAGVVLYGVFSSSQLLLYGLENFVDIISSALVLWRFSQEGKGTEDPLKIASLETRGSVGIAISFVVLACFIFTSSGVGLGAGHAVEEDKNLDILFAVSTVSAFILFTLASVKWTLSSKLQSKVLRKDAICTYVGCVLSIGVCVGTSLAAEPQLWALDPCLSVTVAYSLFLSGMRTLIFHNHKWWQKTFWTMGELRSGIQAMEGIVDMDVQITSQTKEDYVPSLFPASNRKKNHDLMQ